MTEGPRLTRAAHRIAQALREQGQLAGSSLESRGPQHGEEAKYVAQRVSEALLLGAGGLASLGAAELALLEASRPPKPFDDYNAIMDLFDAKVRKMPSWPRSWANFSPL